MASHIASGDEVAVTFRFVGDTLQPGEITALMALKPTLAHAKGDPVAKHPGRKQPTGYWGLDSTLASSCSLDEHLRHLLSQLESRVATIADIKRRECTASLYCAYFISTVTGSLIQLGPDLLERVAALGVPLEVHLYSDIDTAEEG